MFTTEKFLKIEYSKIENLSFLGNLEASETIPTFAAMNVFNDLNNLPNFKNAVVTIGSFDGVHCGHQKILQKINNLAQNIDGESIVVTFHPHPREVIYPKDNSLRLITTIHEKVAYFERYGIDNVVVVPFTIEFSQQKADEYIEKFLVDKFQPKYVVIGYDHRFGLNRQGDISFLKWHGKSAGFEVIEIQKQEIEDIAISSTKIRGAIEKGEIKTANKLLGHPCILTGTVVKGQQVGTTIGFPTANLEIPQKNKLIPADGIYAVYVYHKNDKYKGMLYIGDRPTLKEYDHKTIEVNIFDLDKDLYGDKLQIEFLEKIREDSRFDDLEGLKNQLKTDKISAQKIINNLEAETEKVKIETSRNPSVAVVILNWNGQDLLKQFLPSVFKTQYSNFTTYVIDNASTDNSISFLKKEYPRVEIIELEENYGFAKGYNKGLERVNADYYVLLNSDVEVTENWIAPIIELLEKDKSIGAVQPKIRAQKDKRYFEYAGACGGWMDNLGYPFCRGRILSSVEKDEGQYDDVQEIFWASGAALFIRPNLFHGLGGFDETFFAHMEEIDLCWRIKRAGFKVTVLPKSVVYHVGGSTLNYLSPRKTFLNFRNSYYTLVKNERKGKLTWLIPTRLILDGLAGILFLFQGKFSHILSIIKAHWTFFPQFLKLYRNRSHSQDLIDKLSISAEPNQAGILDKSIIIQYYLRGKRFFHQL